MWLSLRTEIFGRVETLNWNWKYDDFILKERVSCKKPGNENQPSRAEFPSNPQINRLSWRNGRLQARSRRYVT